MRSWAMRVFIRNSTASAMNGFCPSAILKASEEIVPSKHQQSAKQQWRNSFIAEEVMKVILSYTLFTVQTFHSCTCRPGVCSVDCSKNSHR